MKLEPSSLSRYMVSMRPFKPSWRTRNFLMASAREGSDKTHSAPSAANEETLFDKIQELSPHNENQRFLQSQALSMAIQLGQIRSLMLAQKSSSEIGKSTRL